MRPFVAMGLALGALGALPFDARAFLGDDLPGIEAHYGAALNRFQLAPGLEASVHESTGYRVLVLYRDGRSSRETFSKLAAPFDFTAPEIRTFLRAHAAGRRWDSLGAANGASAWARPYALATYLDDGEKTTLSFERTGDDPAVGTAAAQAAAVVPPTKREAGDPLGFFDPLLFGGLDLGSLVTGVLQTGTLDLDRTQTGHLQTGQLQTGQLTLGSLDEPAKPVQSP